MRVQDSTGGHRALDLNANRGADAQAKQLPANFAEQAGSSAAGANQTRMVTEIGSESRLAPATDQFTQAAAEGTAKPRTSGPSLQAPKRQRTKEWTWQKSDAKGENGRLQKDEAAHKPWTPPEAAIGSNPTDTSPRGQPYIDRGIILQRLGEGTGEVKVRADTSPGVQPYVDRSFDKQVESKGGSAPLFGPWERVAAPKPT